MGFAIPCIIFFFLSKNKKKNKNNDETKRRFDERLKSNAIRVYIVKVKSSCVAIDLISDSSMKEERKFSVF